VKRTRTGHRTRGRQHAAASDQYDTRSRMRGAAHSRRRKGRVLGGKRGGTRGRAGARQAGRRAGGQAGRRAGGQAGRRRRAPTMLAPDPKNCAATLPTPICVNCKPRSSRQLMQWRALSELLRQAPKAETGTRRAPASFLPPALCSLSLPHTLAIMRGRWRRRHTWQHRRRPRRAAGAHLGKHHVAAFEGRVVAVGAGPGEVDLKRALVDLVLG
jgi:hypothetical protein